MLNTNAVTTAGGYSPGEIAATLIGSSDATRDLRQESMLAAQWPLHCLIVGESGAGKRRLAQLIHRHSIRCRAPFVAVRCADVTEEVLFAQLFGGRVSRGGVGINIFDRAVGGTVLLEDVDALSPLLQEHLKRFLADDALQQHPRRRMDVRLICSASAPFQGSRARTGFAPDLYYLLNAIYLPVSPLRERPEDVEPLLDYFTSYYARRNAVARPTLTQDCLALCRDYAWPGNVRQLQAAAAMFVERQGSGHRHMSDDLAFVSWAMRWIDDEPGSVVSSRVGGRHHLDADTMPPAPIEDAFQSALADCAHTGIDAPNILM